MKPQSESVPKEAETIATVSKAVELLGDESLMHDLQPEASTRRGEPPFICGLTSAAIIATGRASTTKRIARKARVTPARCAAWECVGSKSLLR